MNSDSAEQVAKEIMNQARQPERSYLIRRGYVAAITNALTTFAAQQVAQAKRETWEEASDIAEKLYGLFGKKHPMRRVEYLHPPRPFVKSLCARIMAWATGQPARTWCRHWEFNPADGSWWNQEKKIVKSPESDTRFCEWCATPRPDVRTG